MPLIQGPFYNINSQYRPNVFLLSMASANPLVLAEASVFVDGVNVTTIRKAPFFDLAGVYYFSFDVAKVLQTLSAPKAQTISSIFDPTLNQPTNVTNTDSHTYTGIVVGYYYRNPTTGQLTSLGITDTIPQTYYSINATRQNNEDMSLDGYIMQGGSPIIPYLTKSPNPLYICDTENEYLTFVPYLSDTVRVVTFDSSGAGIDTGLFAITPNSTFVPTTIGVGSVNLAAVTYFSGSVNMANPNIAGWQIHVGNSYFVGSSWIFVQHSETRVYRLRECCGNRDVRLHWVNRLGGHDAYTFTNKKTRKETNKSSQAQKPLTWGGSIPPNLVHDRGYFKIENETQSVYECESVFYDAEYGGWIAELLSSPEVYLETPEGLVSVVITDSEITIEESDELINVSIKFTESNNISVQRF